MSKRFLCSMVSVAVLAACGGSSPTGSDLCSKATSVVNSFNTKNAACFQGSTGATPPSSTCTQSLTQCSSSDQATLNTYLDCLNGLPACTIATATTWGTQAQACATPVNSVSQACRTATGAGT